ncbi:MAG: leucine-rich repeat domain-containing protein, partial [Ureaplasma sp.]|nr:leucine-rich repeat domain-containing protein [Ureaplasma sp.]
DLYVGLNDYINDDNTKYSLSEFKLAILNYERTIKELIANHLKTSADTYLDVNLIENINMNENNELEITLKQGLIKYSAINTNNVIYGDNTITVKNLNFYKTIKLEENKLNDLIANIQSYINLSANRFTIDEFNANYTSSTFKNNVANYLGISSSLIGSITFDKINNILIISADNLTKFIDDNANKLIVSGNIVISELQFYSIYNINQQQINNFLNQLEPIVKSNNLTYDNINLENDVKPLIESCFNIDTEINLSKAKSSRNTSRFVISVTPVGYYKFVSDLSIIEQSTGALKIDNVGLMNNLEFTNTNLNNLRNSIQSFINSNYIESSTQMSAMLAAIQKYIASNLSSKTGSVPLACIDSISWDTSNNSFIIKPNKIDYYTFAKVANESSSSYYEISNGNIYIKQLSYKSYSSTSSSYFVFDYTNHFAMELSSSGKTLSMIDVPSVVTGINYHIFDNNRNLQVINFTTSGVTTFPNSLFLGCTNLRTLIMGNKISDMGYNMCTNNTNLQTVMLSSNLRTINNSSFQGCSRLMGIDIPNSVNTIGYNSFAGCTNLYTINFGTGLNIIQGSAFENCSSLTRLVLPTNLRTIENNAFLNCSSLLSVKIPDSITTIGSTAFKGCNKLKLFVNNEQTRQKIIGFNLIGISENDIIVGQPN